MTEGNWGWGQLGSHAVLRAIIFRILCPLICICLCVLVGVPQSQAQKLIAQAKLKTSTPPGFERLEETQTTVVDILFGGRLIGSTQATYTTTTITLTNIRELVSAIPLLKNVEAVIQALTGPIATNSDKRCATAAATDCGILRPEVAGVIFDIDRFQLTIFVNAKFLGIAGDDRPKFLGPSDGKLSALVNINAALSDSTDLERQSSVSFGSYFAYKENRVRFDPFYTNTQGFSFTTLVAERDQEKWNYRAGLFQTEPNLFTSNVAILGASIGTILDTRVDLDRAFGNQLVVFLDTASQVSVFINGRLISSEFYPAGNQIIDTRQVPSGANNITLRIRDNRGVERDEQRFFIKSTDIPPIDQPNYFLQAGVLRDLNSFGDTPRFTDTPILRMGTQHRILSNLAVGAGILTSDELALFDLNATYLGNGFRVLAGIASTSDGEVGVNLNGSGQFDNFSWNLNFRGVRQLGDTNPDPAASFDPFVTDSDNVNARIIYRFSEGTIGLFGNWFNSEISDESYSFGADLQYTLFREGPYRVQFRSSLAQTDEETIGTAFIEFSVFGRDYQGSFSSSHRYANRRSGPPTDEDGYSSTERLLVNWRDGNLSKDDWSANLLAENQGDDRFIETGVDFNGDIGRFDVSARRQRVGDINRTSYVAQVSTTLTGSASGMTVGGRDIRNAAIIVGVTGGQSKTNFDVLVNGIISGQVKTGERQIIALQPYETYTVSLQDTGGRIVNFDARPKRVTLYPGNVVDLQWKTQQVVIIVARIVDVNGNPLSAARQKGSRVLAVTEDNGWFQAELTTEKALVFTTTEQQECTVNLPPLKPNDSGVAIFDDLVCR